MIPVKEFQFFNASHIHAVKTAAVKTATVKTAAVDNGGFTNTYYYTYDANGNMTRRSGGSPGTGDFLTKSSKPRTLELSNLIYSLKIIFFLLDSKLTSLINLGK